jgi:hypothetical protein
MAAAMGSGNVTAGRIEDPEKVGSAPDATEEESGLPSPPAALELQRWNESTVNVFRFLSSNYSFILMGMTDGALGVRLLPAYLTSPH